MSMKSIRSCLSFALVIVHCTSAFAAPANTRLEFNGNAYVEIVYSNDLDLEGGEFTLSAWIRPDEWGENNQGRIIDHGGGSSGNLGWALQLENGARKGSPQALRLQINNSRQPVVSDTAAVISGIWQYVAVTFTAGTARFYVDGIARGVSTSVPVPIARNSPVRIGGRATDGQRGFVGAIDDVRIWDRALTQQEIIDSMGIELTGSEFGLLAYLTLNENTGQVAGDLTGHGHDGTLGSTPGVDAADPSWFSALPPANSAPAVDAGADLAIALPINSVTLHGVASDDGLPLGALNLTWSMVSGPGAVSFLNPAEADTEATFVTPGNYVLQLNASDTELDASDPLLVTVYASAVLTNIQVSPDPAVLLTGGIKQFLASGLDQTGQPFAITPTWSATGGSIDGFGSYTAGNITGQFQATASAGSVTGTAGIFLLDNLGPWPTSGWGTALPADMQMEQTLLEQARDYALSGGGSGLITRHGLAVLSWGDTTATFDVKSVTKSVGGLLLGLAIKDNLLALADLAQIHYPAVGANPASNVDTGWLDEITILNLATQTGGFDKTSGYIDILFQPGTTWAYSDGGMNWLADTLTVVNQGDLRPILNNRILLPLGVPPVQLTWSDSANRDLLVEGFRRRELNSSMFMSADAMARLGYLALRNGMWDDQNIIPPSFIDRMRTTLPGVVGLPVANDRDAKYAGASAHYGISWWNNADSALPNVPADAYWAWGLNDHLILVIPSLDIVVSRTGTGWAGSRTPSFYQVLEPFFDPIVQSVSAFGNAAPTVNAGANDSITLPADSISLNGTADDDGLPSGSLTTIWTAIDPPFAVTFLDATAPVTNATFGGPGTYVLRLAASDGILGASSDVIITVNPQIAAGPQTFVTNGDSYINGARSNRNFGSRADIVVHSFGSKTGLVQFDLSSLSGATVSDASLHFRINKLKAAGNINLQLLNEAWTEGTVTFANQPAFGATIRSLPVTATDVGNVVSVDVTDTVQSWADGSQPNHGLRLQTDQGINAAIDSAESTGSPMELLVTVDGGTPANNPPVLAFIGPKNVTVGETLEFQVSATDVDNTTPIVVAANLPGNATTATFTPLGAVATFSWTPTAGDVGIYTSVTVTAIDQLDTAITDSEVITITVSAPAGGGTEQTFTAIEDSFVNGLRANNNFGSRADIVVHSFGPKTGLVRFDLSSLSGVTVSNASLHFRINKLKAGGNINLQLLSEAWTEGTVTFANQPAFGDTILAVPVTAADVGNVVSVDVTDTVQSWADGTQPNHGFRLQTAQGINAAIDSAESTGTPMELVVTVDAGTPTTAMPGISPDGAVSTTPLEISLISATSGASIYYTLDGSAPTTAANFYTAPFTLPASATLKARAFAQGFRDSVVNTAIFSIDVLPGGGINNYWKLNEIAAGSYMNDAGGTAGTCASCPTPGNGVIDSGQSFDGISNVITITDNNSMDWSQNGGFSIEFWVNKSSACAAREVVVGRNDGAGPMQWSVGCDNGVMFFELADTNGTSVTVTGVAVMDDGTWHHVVAVHDGFFNENRLYMDGNLEASGPAAYTAGFGSAADITIGELQNDPGNTFWHGLIDEVASHDRAIPESMINRHYLDGAIGLRNGYVGCDVVDIMPLGDSITAALGYRTTLYFDLTGRGYDVNFVGSRADGIGTGNHDRDNEGWSGFSTTDIAASLSGWLSGNPPEVILLHIGTNDIGAVSVAGAIAGLNSILDIIHAFDSNITVVLAQIINRQTFSQDTSNYNDQMVALVQAKLAVGHRLALVDQESALIYPDDMANLEHPNGFGYAKMAGVWFDGLTNFLPACGAAAPVFSSDPNSSGQLATEYRYESNVLASPDGRFHLLTAPPGMQVHPDTGEVRWIPGLSGQHPVDLQVQNSTGYVVQTFTVTVP